MTETDDFSFEEMKIIVKKEPDWDNTVEITPDINLEFDFEDIKIKADPDIKLENAEEVIFTNEKAGSFDIKSISEGSQINEMILPDCGRYHNFSSKESLLETELIENTVVNNQVSSCKFSSSPVTTSTTTVLDAQMIDFDNVPTDLSPLKEKSSNTIMHNIETVDSKHDAKPHRKNKLHNSSMKIANLKQNIYTLRHRLKKTQTENKQLKAEISNLKSSLEEKHLLSEEWQSLPKKQQEIIHHWFRKFSGDPNGMRYDFEWILDCILLNIRLASGYEFLRTNNYLPLPSKTTLHRYINNLDTDFGFDELFIALKMKLDQLPERERMTQAMIYEKAKLIFKELQKKTPGCTSDQTEECVKQVEPSFTDSKVEQDKDIIPTSEG